MTLGVVCRRFFTAAAFVGHRTAVSCHRSAFTTRRATALTVDSRTVSTQECPLNVSQTIDRLHLFKRFMSPHKILINRPRFYALTLNISDILLWNSFQSFQARSLAKEQIVIVIGYAGFLVEHCKNV